MAIAHSGSCSGCTGVSFLVVPSQTVADLADGYPLFPRDIWHIDGLQFLLQRRHSELSGWIWKGIQGLTL